MGSRGKPSLGEEGRQRHRKTWWVSWQISEQHLQQGAMLPLCVKIPPCKWPRLPGDGRCRGAPMNQTKFNLKLSIFCFNCMFVGFPEMWMGYDFLWRKDNYQKELWTMGHWLYQPLIASPRAASCAYLPGSWTSIVGDRKQTSTTKLYPGFQSQFPFRGFCSLF